MKAARKALQTPPPEEEPFWRRKTLAEMSRVEWESLCDGCGKCCLLKLEYEDTGEIDWSNIACRQLDPQTCRCRNYALRKTGQQQATDEGWSTHVGGYGYRPGPPRSS